MAGLPPEERGKVFGRLMPMMQALDTAAITRDAREEVATPNVPLVAGITGRVFAGHEHRVVVMLQGPGLSAAVSDTDPGDDAKVQRVRPPGALDDSPEATRTAEALRDLGNVRMMAMAADGTLYVTRPGSNDVIDNRVRLVDGELVSSVENVDQSIQPGDGGFGFMIDASGYRQLGSSGQYAGYLSGVYLMNPKETNGVETFRGAENEQIMSVADQYLFRTGVLAAPRVRRGWGVGLGGRIEGVPVHDLIGGSDGFRRPGYAISVEPSVTFSRGPHAVSLSLPIAVQRNRQRSVPDLEVPGRIGDAAFADWVLLLGYFRRF